MDTFNNNAASGNDMVTGTQEDVLSNEQMNYAPQLNDAQQTEYSSLQNFDFSELLNYDEDMTEPTPAAPVASESAVIDPRILSDAGQQSNDLPNTSLYNDMSTFDPNQGIYNAGGLFVDTTSVQPNIPFQYQQNQVSNNRLQTNLLQQQLLERQIEQKKIEAETLAQNSFGLNSMQQTPLEQGGFPSPYFQQILNSDLQAPQPTSAVQPGSLLKVEDLDSPILPSLEEGQDYAYRNEILNEFEEPVVALQIIDQLEYPFPARIQDILKKELSRLEDLKTAKVLESEIEEETKPKAGRKKNNNSSKITKTPGKIPGNKRSANVQKTIAVAAGLYKDIPSKVASWGSMNPDTGRPTFEYTKYGELTLGQYFTSKQISDYLAYHPSHGTLPNGQPDTKKSGLKLWIQYAGADSNDRYPSTEKSNKCRFVNCPRDSHSIKKGEPRICFDEQRFPDFPTNPYHNAGYVHLYCFEREFDFPEFCKNFNVAPDVRDFPGDDVNRSAITKSFEGMEKVVNDFIRDSKPWPEFNANGQRPNNWFKASLSSHITEYHLAHEPKPVQRARDKRGGNSIDKYRGDLDLWAVIEQEMKEKKAKQPRGGKRKVRDVEEEEDDEDAEGSDEEPILDEEILERPIKRTRRS